MGEKSRLQAGVRVFENVEELSTGLADYIAQLSEANVRERGAFTLAISGGDVPKLLRKLTERPYVRTVDWTKWHIFWADETLVAKTHQLSHYRQARQEFLSKVPVLPRHVYPVNVVVSGEQAAEEYEFMVRQRVKDQTVRVAGGSDHPMFDLILLSLEPNSPPLLLASNNGDDDDDEEEEEGGVGWVRHVKGTPERITFTLPVLNAAANIALLASSSSSSSALRHCSYGNLDHGISPVDGHLAWFVHAAVGSPGSSPDS